MERFLSRQKIEIHRISMVLQADDVSFDRLFSGRPINVSVAHKKRIGI